MNMRSSDLFDISQTIAGELLAGRDEPWSALAELKAFILRLGAALSGDEYEKIGEDIWIARDATVAPTAFIKGPTIIDHGAEIRHCAFIRGSAIIGRGCVVGNSTELKNSLLFNNVQVPHFNYIGDSILGYRSHMGAGSVTSNVKSDKSLVHIKCEGLDIATGLKKLGALIGDYTEVGCNSVLNPGTVLGRNAMVYPTSSVRGCVPENHIFKDAAHIVPKK